MTLKKAKITLREIGMTISSHVNGCEKEYRVNKIGGREATAYYTNDIEDAVNTAKSMNENGNW